MQLKNYIIFAFFFSFFSILKPHNYDKLILFQPPALKFYNNEPILLKHKSLQKLTQVWQKRLTKIWTTFFKNLEEEIGLQPEQLEMYLEDDNLHNLYVKGLQDEMLNPEAAVITQENIDPEVLNFVKRIVQKYCSKKNVEILLVDNLPSYTLSLGSSKTTLYLLCHSELYNQENIQYFYDNLNSETGTFCLEQLNNGSYNIIEKSNFLLVKLIEAATHLQHESHLLAYLLCNFKLPNSKVPSPLIKTLLKLTDLRGQLETILQSKNPLETALFMAQSGKKTKAEWKLWQKLIHELASCYQPQSLLTFKRHLAAAQS